MENAVKPVVCNGRALPPAQQPKCGSAGPSAPLVRGSWLPITGVMIMSFLWAGCGSDKFAASSGSATPAEGPVQLKPVLSPGDERRIESAFDSLARGHKAANPPRAAATVRWSDVP